MNVEMTRTTRVVQVTLIPDGIKDTLPEQTIVVIKQELGGSFTVQLQTGQLARVEGEDADAIGRGERKDPNAKVKVEGSLEDAIWDQMRTVFDPEIPVNIVELGLIYECKVDTGTVAVVMTLTAPGCGMGQVLQDDVKRKIASLEGVEAVNVELVFDPPWDKEMMSDAAKLQLGFL